MVKLTCLTEHSRLHATELLLPFFGKNFRNRFPETLLYIKIKVYELPTHAVCESPAKSSLATRHISDYEHPN